MGYKVNDNKKDYEDELKAKLSSLGLKIIIPDDEEENKKKEEKNELYPKI